MPVVGTGDVLERLEFPGRHLNSREFQSLCVLICLIGKLEIQSGFVLREKEEVRKGVKLTELAPMYRTFPLSTTSFSAFIISSRGVSRSSR